MWGALDLVLVLCAVFGAAAYLTWAIGFRNKKPSCHPAQDDDESSNVVVGGALQKGLDRAKARQK